METSDFKDIYEQAGGAAGYNTGTSIFDPVLCELAYQWFNIPNGKILDPFAGGSVRGIVAAKLGFQYLGNDLSRNQIEANRVNASEVLGDSEIQPTWTCGDSLNIDVIAKGYTADMIFSCPPYGDLEVYSDKKEDISNMPYVEFLKIYRGIIQKCVAMLNNDRFAVFVVGDIRDKAGFYRNFVSDTITAFLDSGLRLYNEMILVNAIGSLPIRTGKQFSAGRKVGKHHQNVLVFYKGNPKNIKANYPELDLSYLNEIGMEE
jgi:DNA modification methylase